VTPPGLLYVASVPFVGGAELTQLAVVEEMAAVGWRVKALVPGENELRERLRDRGISVTVVPDLEITQLASRYGRGPSSAAGAAAMAVPSVDLIREIRRPDCGVVYCGGLRAQARSSLASRLTGKRLVWHVHEHYSGIAARLLQALALAPHLVLTVSRSVARQRALRTARNVEPVLNGVPSEFLASSPDRKADAPLIGMVGHLTPLKGHFAFLDLTHSVRNSVGHMEAVIIGDAPYLTAAHQGYPEAVRQRADEADVSVVCARPEEMPRHFAAMDVLVHLAERPEGFGRAVAEAQASGVPVVTYSWGGVSEIVSDGETGLLVDPGDRKAARDATVQLLRDKALRERLGKAARDHAHQRLRQERAARQSAEAIARLCW
jgi:glycosyltransferase involved in cell wall biosynthesis